MQYRHECTYVKRPKADRPRMRARAYVWSCDKDSSHTIRSAISKNPMLHPYFMLLCFTERELLQIEDVHVGNRDFGPFLLL